MVRPGNANVLDAEPGPDNVQVQVPLESLVNEKCTVCPIKE